MSDKIEKFNFETSLKGVDFNSFGNKTFLDNLKQADLAIKEIDQEQKNFNHSHSQFSWKHFIINGQQSKSRSIRQVASEIQSKKSALIENKYKIILDQNEADRFENIAVTEKDHYQKTMYIIKAEQLRKNLENTIMYFEGALKDVMTLSAIYKDLTKDFKTEEDFENAENDYWIRRLVTQSIWDYRAEGRIRIGNQEALEQIGINVTRLSQDVFTFINSELEGKDVTTENMNIFLDECVDKYKGCPDNALQLSGISPDVVKDALFYDGDKK
tara:strand:+ start:83 stop:895 length:813 start_codon:yes stop_codon:yes gene_type:complete